MTRFPRRGRFGDLPGQLQINWNASTPPAVIERTHESSDASAPVSHPDSDLVQRLKWDFRTTFPPPTAEALDAGILSDEDAEPENVKALHGEHAREALVALRSIDAVLDARRRGVDPKTGRPPTAKEDREGLQDFLQYEHDRFQRWWQTLMDTYQEAFGPEATDAFGKAIRAWHAGIEVVGETKRTTTPTLPAATPVSPTVTVAVPATPAREPPSRQRRSTRITARLPAPRPLPSAIAAGHFGQEENGKPVRPGTAEVREITETHAEKLIAMLDQLRSAPAAARDRLQGDYAAGLTAYAEDFGIRAAQQLEAYVARQAGLDAGSRRGR